MELLHDGCFAHDHDAESALAELLVTLPDEERRYDPNYSSISVTRMEHAFQVFRLLQLAGLGVVGQRHDTESITWTLRRAYTRGRVWVTEVTLTAELDKLWWGIFVRTPAGSVNNASRGRSTAAQLWSPCGYHPTFMKLTEAALAIEPERLMGALTVIRMPVSEE